MRYILTTALLGLFASGAYGASTAQSSAYGEYVSLHILPVLGSPIVVTSGPLPVASGAAAPPYSNGNQVASATVSAAGLATLLQTGLLIVHASSGVPNTNAVSADATVNNSNATVAALFGLRADVIQSTVSIGGACGNLTTAGTTTLANARLSGLLGVSLAANPAPNTVVLDSLGVRIVLNEQIATGNGATDSGLTVNAIHITFTNAVIGLGLLSGQIVISQSQASMHCQPSNADLSLVKTASPSPVNAGENITYTIHAVNHGPDAATNVKVSDTLPAGETFVSAMPSQGSCTGTAAIVCNLGSLSAGASANVVIVATVVSGTSVTNSATVSSDVPDNSLLNNTSTLTTTVTSPAADLGLTKTASPRVINVGETIDYTLVVTNTGPGGAPNTIVTDTLPPDVAYVSSTSSQGACSGTTTIICALGSLNPGGSATITIRVRGTQVPANPGRRTTNTASVKSGAPDPNTANNTATVVNEIH